MARQRYQPGEEQRRLVKTLAGCGVRHQDICEMVGLRSPNSLRRHFRRELSLAMVEMTAKVRQTAFRLATSGRHPRMTMFWLRTRARWSPRPEQRPAVIEEYVIEDYQPPGTTDQPGTSVNGDAAVGTERD
jgi:hypothetical protein